MMFNDYEYAIESFSLIPSDGGCFELMINNRLIYSKLKTGRHAEMDELKNLVTKFLREG